MSLLINYKNNNSKIEPALSCNHKKYEIMNNNYFKRIIPDVKKKNKLDFRPQINNNCNFSNKIKQNIIEKDILKIKLNKLNVINNINCNFKQNYFPGKGDFKNYSKNIDIESDIRNLNQPIQNNNFNPKCLQDNKFKGTYNRFSLWNNTHPGSNSNAKIKLNSCPRPFYQFIDKSLCKNTKNIFNNSTKRKIIS